MRHLTRIVIGVCFLLLISCSHSGLRDIGRPEKRRELTQKAVFEYLERPNIFLAGLTGKGLIKLDPLLSYRAKLSVNGKVYFDTPMHSSFLKYPLPKKSYRLVIPDSLAEKYTYTSSDEDYEHDYAIIHQFSPLLPSREPSIYFMEHHIWANKCEDKGCYRGLDRIYLKFKVEGQKVTYLDGVGLSNQIDFIGFGGFSREKMENALPGEKIAKFGH